MVTKKPKNEYNKKSLTLIIIKVNRSDYKYSPNTTNQTDTSQNRTLPVLTTNLNRKKIYFATSTLSRRINYAPKSNLTLWKILKKEYIVYGCKFVRCICLFYFILNFL